MEEEQQNTQSQETQQKTSQIFVLRTTANREQQALDFIAGNAKKKALPVYAAVHPHGMRGYIFVEAASRGDAEQAAFKVPYARNFLPNALEYQEIEHMLESNKQVDVNIQKNDIVEIISGPFKREQAKITRVNKLKSEVIVEFLEAAVPIPITLKLDAVKVIRRETKE